jgi:hypothetical protein
MKDVSLPKRVMIPLVAPAAFAGLFLIGCFLLSGLFVAAMAVAITGRSTAADGILVFLLGEPE